jgi:hypothetical protein
MATIEVDSRPMPWSNAMNRFFARAAVAAFFALGGWASVIPAVAAPPTVTPSPGYDARLQEQRAAQTVAPVAPASKPVTTRRAKRTKAN